MSLDPQTARRIEREAFAVVDADPQTAAVRAQQIFRDAQRHKHEARRHDRRAAVGMVTFKAFKARLEELGVTVIVETSPPPQATSAQRGGRSDNRDQSPRAY